MKFSIKSLLILTVVVALWVMAGKWFYEALPTYADDGTYNHAGRRLLSALIGPPLVVIVFSFIPFGIFGMMHFLVSCADRWEEQDTFPPGSPSRSVPNPPVPKE